MALKVWMFLLAMTLPDVSLKVIDDNINSNSENVKQYTEDSRVVSIVSSENDRCLARLESAIGSLSPNRMTNANVAMIDLTGYALHQSLKTVPVQMYVTDMRVKVPGTANWAKVERCRFDPNTKILQAKLVFKDLIVSASVKLLHDDYVKHPTESVADKCNMTLRLRQAGLGFVVIPQQIKTGAVGIRTSATFVDPNFVSIHAYNCQPIDVHDQQRSADNGFLDAPEPRNPSTEDVSQEMEDVFLRGIRSLLTKYMEKHMQPALKDTLMLNLGYTISYGKK